MCHRSLAAKRAMPFNFTALVSLIATKLMPETCFSRAEYCLNVFVHEMLRKSYIHFGTDIFATSRSSISFSVLVHVVGFALFSYRLPSSEDVTHSQRYKSFD